MAFPSETYRDPADWLERVQSRTCAGCKWLRRPDQFVPIEFIRLMSVCMNSEAPMWNRRSGSKCRKYEEISERG